MKITKTTTLMALLAISGCVANDASVSTTVSPIDGKSTTVINGSAFSTSYIYPISGTGLGMEVAGGSVTNKDIASIVFEASSSVGFREAFFKADGITYDLKPTKALTNFETNGYGTIATKEFLLSCSDILNVSQSSEVYLRVTFADGFVDYDVSKSKNGTDGFAMIKKIASYCK
ncbi:hypothetical protein [Thalassotalea aquiviva]|uniref:hypothetical protein n=1 Tax=Thalassotalea aquiviva TaxID=3242415 RepID=UPI00352AE447